LLAFCFAIFVVFGVVLVLVGANQDALAAALDIGLAESGLLTSVLALGIGSGMAVGGPLADRVSRRALALGAVWTAGAALVGVTEQMSFARLLVHVYALGAGAGMANLVFNVAVVQRFAEQAPRRLLMMHSAATLGAIVGPALAALLGDPEHWTPSFRAAGATYLALSLWLWRVPLGDPDAVRGEATSLEPGAPLELAALCLAAFAYLGVEAALTVFAVPYAVEGLGLPADRGRAAISAFWLGLFAGRMGALLWRGALDARAVAVSGAAAAVALAAAAMLWTPRVEWVFGLAGLTLGPVFPLLVALGARSLPARPGLATGVLTGVGSLGGFVLPWLAGAVGDRGGVDVSIATLVVAAAVLGGAAVLAFKLRRRPADPEAGLCASCLHARRIANRRGSEFWQCGRAEADPAYRRYPELPVLECAGHVRSSSTPSVR
jgi:fucose permease